MAPDTARMESGHYDKVLLFAVAGLVAMGLIMVYSASSALAAKTYGADTYFLKRQALFAMLGVMCMIVLRYLPYTVYRKLAYPILGLSLVLLGLLFVPGLGVKVGGATRWLRAGPVNFQPSEFARLAVIIYLAYSMARKGDKMSDFSVGVIPHMIIIGIVGALFMSQPDFGSIALLVAVAMLMIFVGGGRFIHLFGLVASVIPVGAMLIIGREYRLMRVLAFLDPWANQTGEGYQITHSLMAFGTGGVSGVGVGNGYQKLFYLPEPHTDFVFSVLGEEMGLWGVGLVIALYCVLVWRGFTLAQRVPDAFGKYLAFGISSAIGLQACVNMAVTMNLLPTKGLALPFISYGGSSLLLNLVCIGILLNIAARHNGAPVEKPAPKKKDSFRLRRQPA